MIFLNSEHFMTEAVESVLAQTFKDWELTFVDDGSTDGSTAIAKSYAERWPDRIRYLEHPRHENRGMSISRNAGIRASSGQFIAMLDSDDVWLPGRLERHVDILKTNLEAHMVYGIGMYWHSWDPESAQRDMEYDAGVPKNTVIQPPTLVPVLLQWGGPNVSSWLARRSSGDQIGWYDESFPGVGEDDAFFAKFFLEFGVYPDSQCLTRYRVHSGSWSALATRSKQLRQREWVFFLSWVRTQFKMRNVQDPALWEVLRNSLLSTKHPLLYRFRPSNLMPGTKRLIRRILSSPRLN